MTDVDITDWDADDVLYLINEVVDRGNAAVIYGVGSAMLLREVRTAHLSRLDADGDRGRGPLGETAAP